MKITFYFAIENRNYRGVRKCLISLSMDFFKHTKYWVEHDEIEFSGHDLAEFSASGVPKTKLYVMVFDDEWSQLSEDPPLLFRTKAAAESFVVKWIDGYEKHFLTTTSSIGGWENPPVEVVKLGDEFVIYEHGERQMRFEICEGEIELSALLEAAQRVS
jgi:hypothetical protein